VDEPAAYRTVVQALLEDPAVSETLMMGMPSLKNGSKMFGGLRVSDSFLLKNNIREILFRKPL